MSGHTTKKRGGLRWMVPAAVLLVLGLGAWEALRLWSVAGVATGQVIPNLTLPDLSGRAVALSAFRGRPLVLRLSSVGCSYCSDDWSDLEGRQQEAAGRYQIVAVEVGQSLGAVRTALAGLRSVLGEHQTTLPVLVDAEGRLARSLGLRGVPSYAFVDSQGRLVSLVWAANQHTALSRDEWAYYLGRLLGK